MIVKLARRRSGTGGVTTTVTIPRPLAEMLDKAKVEAFSVDLTEDGLLLRPVKADAKTRLESLPHWLQASAVPSPDGNGKADAKTRRATRTDAERAATA